MSTDLASHILSHSLFKELDEGTLAELERELDRVRLDRGEVLLCQGDPGEALYILIRGRLGVKIGSPDGTDMVVDELEPGVSVGDMELLTGRACVATVYALEDAELVRTVLRRWRARPARATASASLPWSRARRARPPSMPSETRTWYASPARSLSICWRTIRR